MVKAITSFIFSMRTILLISAGLTCFIIGIQFAVDKHPAWLTLAILGFVGCAFIDLALENK